ncbi:TPR-like protein [Amniculicola lignicola CBS 123094]|uniref:TPR-like protein n=1 Tax=Amniculicola lignicola CBS 123094 TaxID=1392246 RepID=A0A6A5WNB8_9PLEO|nr:TPR-like protein [Amniculicola lignicola CBS 123094]
MAGDPRALLMKAEKLKIAAGGGFSFFGSKTDKFEQAADAYLQAANAFRMLQHGREAGDAFLQAAAIQRDQLKELDDEAQTLQEAFKAYRKEDPLKAANCLDKTIQHYCSKGNFRRAATFKEQLGDMFEEEASNMPDKLEALPFTLKAAAAYKDAASWYDADNATALANKLWLKTADIFALLGGQEPDKADKGKADRFLHAFSSAGLDLPDSRDPNDYYYKAIAIYRQVAEKSLNNNLMRYSVKEYLFKASICHICTMDPPGIKKAFADFSGMYPQFAKEREGILIMNLAFTMDRSENPEAPDPDKFGEHLFVFNDFMPLDKWKITLLLRVKEKLIKKDAGALELDEEDDFA